MLILFRLNLYLKNVKEVVFSSFSYSLSSLSLLFSLAVTNSEFFLSSPHLQNFFLDLDIISHSSSSSTYPNYITTSSSLSYNPSRNPLPFQTSKSSSFYRISVAISSLCLPFHLPYPSALFPYLPSSPTRSLFALISPFLPPFQPSSSLQHLPSIFPNPFLSLLKSSFHSSFAILLITSPPLLHFNLSQFHG